MKSQQANIPVGHKADPDPTAEPQERCISSQREAALTDSALSVTVMILLVQKHACVSYSGDAWAQNHLSGRGSH